MRASRSSQGNALYDIVCVYRGKTGRQVGVMVAGHGSFASSFRRLSTSDRSYSSHCLVKGLSNIVGWIRYRHDPRIIFLAQFLICKESHWYLKANGELNY